MSNHKHSASSQKNNNPFSDDENDLIDLDVTNPYADYNPQHEYPQVLSSSQGRSTFNPFNDQFVISDDEEEEVTVPNGKPSKSTVRRNSYLSSHNDLLSTTDFIGTNTTEYVNLNRNNLEIST